MNKKIELINEMIEHLEQFKHVQFGFEKIIKMEDILIMLKLYIEDLEKIEYSYGLDK